jgi:hypothetical protein
MVCAKVRPPLYGDLRRSEDCNGADSCIKSTGSLSFHIAEGSANSRTRKHNSAVFERLDLRN